MQRGCTESWNEWSLSAQLDLGSVKLVFDPLQKLTRTEIILVRTVNGNSQLTSPLLWQTKLEAPKISRLKNFDLD